MTAEFFNDLILKYKKENDAQNFISELGANYTKLAEKVICHMKKEFGNNYNEDQLKDVIHQFFTKDNNEYINLMYSVLKKDDIDYFEKEMFK